MSNTPQNFVTFHIALTACNMALLGKINELVAEVASDQSETVATTKAPVKATATSTAKAPTKATKVDEVSEPVTLDEVKASVTAAKKAHGEEFVYFAIKEAGYDAASTLLATVKSIKPADYESVVKSLSDPETLAHFKMETEELGSDDLDDDDLGAAEHLEELDAETVGAAIRAMVKAGKRTEAGEIIRAAGGAGKISCLESMNQKQLAQVLKAAV